MLRGRRKGRGNRRGPQQITTGLDTPSDSPKRKDSKLEFRGHLSHFSPRVTDALITHFFHPDIDSEVEKNSVPAMGTKLSTPPKNNAPAHEEIASVGISTRQNGSHCIISTSADEPKPGLPANKGTVAKSREPSPEVIVLSDDEHEDLKAEPKSLRKSLNPSQAVNQMASPPVVTKLGKVQTNTAKKTNNDANRKLTEYFPVRRSVRKTKKTVLEEKQKTLEEAVLSAREEGLQVHNFEGKGRGVVTTRFFQKGEFVVEYAGELIKIDEARHREKVYAQDQNTGCYMYYFKYRNNQYCVDATAETDRLGRLVNHSRNGNLLTKTIAVGSTPRLVLVAKEDISVGEEVTYDYGDRSKESLRYHPWLAN